MTKRWELATCRQVGAKVARDIRSHRYCREAAYLNSSLKLKGNQPKLLIAKSRHLPAGPP